MNNIRCRVMINPFERIAGTKALLWGVAVIIVSTVMSYISGWHYHGMLHFGPAPNNSLWCHAVEHLTVWLIPAIVFYIGGLIMSPSRIRPVDVFGTTAFAQIPLSIMGLVSYCPTMQALNEIDEENVMQIASQPWFAAAMALSLVIIFAVVMSILWMYNALKVSCNLSGYRLKIFFIAAYIGCEVICRYIIGACY